MDRYPIWDGSPEQEKEPPGSFLLTADAGNLDDDGSFILSWSQSLNADNYTIYSYSKYITEINGSLTKIQEGLAVRSFPIQISVNGTFYFAIEANNELGSTLSNCIVIVVKIPSVVNTEISFGNFFLIFSILGVISVIFYKNKNYLQRLK